ncbi:hypothetical protein BDM02DRAFT_3119713 [Thelephora ganbajun]|uniref:Uncharacterized protein n=1 Tax=Thelephora ganbajun TaxID=370292 RepID=A0ACB6Z8W1_THEGA|nr:hypothetical protein BDM02DRAFT_3119713 [Thelephora ganbajun]
MPTRPQLEATTTNNICPLTGDGLGPLSSTSLASSLSSLSEDTFVAIEAESGSHSRPLSRSRSRSSDSTSSSDSSIIHHTTTSTMSTFATVKDRNPKIAPTLTSGKITPEVLYRWERSCKEHFRVKDITEKKKVESVLSRLQDFRIADWVEANGVTLKTLEFSAFMEKLRKEALGKDWDRKIKLNILASKQGERPFHEWVYEMQTRNALLRGRQCHFNEEALRETLENNMDQGLELRMRRIVLAEETSLREWIEAVKTEDEFVTREREMAREVVREMLRKEQKGAKATGRIMGTRIDNTAPTMQRSTASTTALPKLTPAERALIFEHQGCFKCRQLYVDHKGANCPNGFPPSGTYKTLTSEYAEAVRDSKNKSRSRAPGPVTHVGYDTVEGVDTRALPSAVLGVGEEESDDSSKYVRTRRIPPLFSEHLEWRCRVGGPSVSEPVAITALITDDSDKSRITSGSPQIIGWISQIVPELPRRGRQFVLDD